jgi:predicted nucleic acid-binding protein
VTLLDAYAVIGFLADEPNADDVDQLIRRGGCRLTNLGLAEVIDRMTRLYDAEPDGIAVDIATLGLESPIPLDAATGVLAARLRAQHFHRTTRAVGMADCVLAAAARIAGEAVATSDPHLLGLCQD